MGQLDGKVVIITGASSGIGRAAAMLFAQEGAKLVINARRQAELDELAKAITQQHGDVVAVAGDITEEDTAVRLADTAVTCFGGLDVAFNNAGALGAMGPVQSISQSGWHDTLNANLSSAFLCAKYQIPAMQQRGKGALIFTSTFVGHHIGFPGMAAYAAAKAGIVGLTRVLAAELGPVGIRANAILAGGTDTPMGQAVANTPEAKAFVAGLHALKRMARPEEIAQAALYLASDASSFITGAAMAVDGGVTITRT